MGQDLLLLPSGYRSESVVDHWAWIMWSTKVCTCVFMNVILEMLLCRTTILWDFNEVAMAAVLGLILSCGSHSKVRRSIYIQ